MNWIELTIVLTYFLSMIIALIAFVYELVGMRKKGIDISYGDVVTCIFPFIPIFNMVVCCIVISTEWDKVKNKTAFKGKKR